MAKAKTVHRCTDCGHESPKWMGKCPGCGAWNTLTEERVEAPVKAKHDGRTFRLPKAVKNTKPVLLSEVTSAQSTRIVTGLSELDRVLGGGVVAGGMVLVGGDPGIGKSTLLLGALDRIAKAVPDKKPLYVSGEESPEQVKLRAERLGVDAERVMIFAETRADRIVEAIERDEPSAVIIDSIQSVYDPTLESAPGSVSQIREVAARFLYLAKAIGVPTMLVGHVTKAGALAGPRVLEHMVDTVLYFETTGGHPYRILRAHKNRFGSTNEIGVFEMQEKGLVAVENPSELFLAERPEDAPGSVVLPALEGTRPLLVEVQALVSPTSFGNPRRTCLGFDASRAALLTAVLERRAGLELLGCDVFVNVAGGIDISEPAADLAVATALASSLGGKPVPGRTVVFGEIGLAGELRAISQAELRIAEAKKLGFERAVMPAASRSRVGKTSGLDLVGAKTIGDALDAILS